MQSEQLKNSVLDKDAVKRKLKRMALEIAERNATEDEIVIAAINGNGEVVAKQLSDELSKVAPFNIQYITIRL
ncbi:MAG TPA: hypothetical protein VM368_05320, partial [Flavisolibacter sp.]|nr:hypothetical protein [Flavisolibacter sp.]